MENTERKDPPTYPSNIQASEDPPGLKERLAALKGDGDWFDILPVKRAAWVAAAVLVVWTGARWIDRSFRAVRSGEAGVAVNKMTGTVGLYAPGSYFLPQSLYELSTVRVSDQLLSGGDGHFTVSTKDGISVELDVQARYAIDRSRLLSTWASLPASPAHEVIGPVLASEFRNAAPAYEATTLLAEKREELAATSTRRARERLRESGIELKDVYVGALKLPAEFEHGRMALLQETQEIDKKEATLRLKKQEIEQGRLEAEAVKVRQEKAAESEASQKLIRAKAEADAMSYILPLKLKEIEQKKLEGDAEKARVVKQAEAAAEAGKIQTLGEAERRKTLADAEAYAIRITSLAQFENMKREAELIQANPMWVSKTFAEKISDKVQVILTPTLSSSIYTDEVMKRLANGKPAVAERTAPVSQAVSTGTSRTDSSLAPVQNEAPEGTR
jgi:regulator of protease activity HflC (stomatin/prohibitin superfamily)